MPCREVAQAGCLRAGHRLLSTGLESKSNGLDKAATLAAISIPGSEAGRERSDNDLKMKLVWCPAGKFTMGNQQSTDPRYRAEVTLTRGFWLGKYEVTQREYQRIMGENPSCFSAQGEGAKDLAGPDTARLPVEQVSWEDAIEFCEKLTQQERKAGRLPAGWIYTLPTEAQWEYACRAGTTTKYSFGDKLERRRRECRGRSTGWLCDGARWREDHRVDHNRRIVPCKPVGIARHARQRLGMVSRLRTALPGGTDPEVTLESKSRIYRGGDVECNAYDCDSALRRSRKPTHRYRYLGFRVALSLSSR